MIDGKKNEPGCKEIEENVSLKRITNDHAKSLLCVPVELVEKISDLRSLHTSLSLQQGRHKIRLIKDLEAELHILEKDKEAILLGSKRREYLAKSEDYLKQYEKSNDDSARGNISDSVVRLADTQNPVRYRKRSDLCRTIRMASRNLNDRDVEKHSIHDEFLSEFHGFVPPVYIAHGDLCPNCNIPLRREQESSLVCSQCGFNLQFQDAVSANVSWSDEMDYVSFQYKRANHFSNG